MTTELEKQFFETFGIEPKYKDYRTKNGKEYECKNPSNRNIRLCYPQITDRHYLELICIGSQFFAELVLLTSDNIEDLKEQVLIIYLKTAYKEKIKHQVQKLFKGE